MEEERCLSQNGEVSMHREQPTASEDLEIYAPLTPEELEQSQKKSAMHTGSFGHHIQIDLPFVNPLCLDNKIRRVESFG